MDEVDFIDFTNEKYGIQSAMITQDRGRKFYDEAREYFAKKQWEDAIRCYDKVISSTNKQLHAEAHFNKGLSYLNAKRFPTGCHRFIKR